MLCLPLTAPLRLMRPPLISHVAQMTFAELVHTPKAGSCNVETSKPSNTVGLQDRRGSELSIHSRFISAVTCPLLGRRGEAASGGIVRRGPALEPGLAAAPLHPPPPCWNSPPGRGISAAQAPSASAPPAVILGPLPAQYARSTRTAPALQPAHSDASRSAIARQEPQALRPALLQRTGQI